MLLVILITSIRIFFDFTLLEYPIELDIFQHYVRFYLENIYYFIIVFLLVVFFISKVIKGKILSVANLGIKFFPVIIIPPLIDFFIFNRIKGYEYSTVENFFYNLFTISWLKGDASVGISLEITIALLFIGGYVYYNQRSILKSLLAVFFITLFLVIISTPEIFFGYMADYIYLKFLPNYYFFPLILLSGFLIYHHKKERLIGILSNLRPVKSIIFILTVFLGSFAIISFGYVFELYKMFLASLAIFFVWQFSIVINDIYDYKIDKISNRNRPLIKNLISVDDYGFVALVFAFFALSFSAIVNIYVFLLIILGILLAIIYSTPPIRLRKNYLGNLLIGSSLVISFMVGVLAFGNFELLFEENIVRYIFLIFLLSTVVTFTKDLKDIKADSKYGIKNFYTVFGKEKGKIIVTVLVSLVLNIPVIILREFMFAPFILAISLLTAYLYYKKEDEKLVYLLSTFLMIGIFLRLFYF